MRLTRKSRDVNMTQGNIFKLLLWFTLPLMLGNFFQFFYNTVDSWVVGNYVSSQALGAVGSVAPIVNTVVSIFSGMAAGAGTVISQYFGASDDENLSSAVHTAILFTIAIGVASTLFGVIFTDRLLLLMKTPKEILPDATIYLRIYFAGILGLMLYNIEAGILRAVGDSTRPFWALVVSSIINVVLDLVFVKVFHMGVAGVAYATIIAQFVSSAYLLFVLVRSDTAYRIRFKGVTYKKYIFTSIIRIGMPAAIQMGVTSFSNVFVQSYVNKLGDAVVTGWVSFNKVDQLIILPVQSISLAMTTFAGQNIGVGRIDRTKKGLRVALAMTVTITLALLVPMMLFARPIVSLFTKDILVVGFGAYLLRLVTPFYVSICVNQVIAGTLRGVGITQVPMAIMLASFVGVRQLYLYLITLLGYGQDLTLVALSYPAGWIICSMAFLAYFKFFHWEEYAMRKRMSRLSTPETA